MIFPVKYDVNQAAFRRLQPTIDATYPAKQFVAIDDGQIVADAGTFEELEQKLAALGKGGQRVLVMQAGEYYPEFAYILTIQGKS